MRTLLVVLAWMVGTEARHLLYRDARGAGGGGDTRRVFGGRAAQLAEWGAVCALLDRYWSARCSGSVLTSRWALTAAHCVTARVAYVGYNTRAPRRGGAGGAAPVHLLYRHPHYRAEERDLGAGPDVALLHHDVGLVRTRSDMVLSTPPALPPLRTLALHDARALLDEPVDVLGFGEAETGKGEELRAARLSLAACGRPGWRPCVCGAGSARAVCAGDSGGPVLYRGALLALTSMGPVECGEAPPAPGPAPRPLTSVFTELRQYVVLLNATMSETDEALSTATAPLPARPLLLPVAAWWLLHLCCSTH